MMYDKKFIDWMEKRYPCDNCYYNGGQYCMNDDYADNFNDCSECEGWEEDE